MVPTISKTIFLFCQIVSKLDVENLQELEKIDQNQTTTTKKKINGYRRRSHSNRQTHVKDEATAIHKDVLPTFQQSNVVYEYVCHCDSRYVCRTSQRLQDRIRQHVPKSIRNRTSQDQRKQPERPGKLANSIPHCDSAIGNHLLHNQKCASHYKDNQFFILSKARSDFHLSVLESIFITLQKPNLCRRKEFVYKHKLLV